MNEVNSMEIMIPVWPDDGKTQIAKSDLKMLAGTTVALVDDNFDYSFSDELERILRDEYGALVKRLLKPLASAPSPSALIDEAAQCRVAIVGIAL